MNTHSFEVLLTDATFVVHSGSLTIKVVEVVDVPSFYSHLSQTTTPYGRRSSLHDLFQPREKLHNLHPYLSLGVSNNDDADDQYTSSSFDSPDFSLSEQTVYEKPDLVRKTTIKTHNPASPNLSTPSWYDIWYPTPFPSPPPSTPPPQPSASSTQQYKFEESISFDEVNQSSTLLIDLYAKASDPLKLPVRSPRPPTPSRSSLTKSLERTALSKTRTGKIHRRRRNLESSVAAAAATVANFLHELEEKKEGAGGSTPTQEVHLGKLAIPLSRLPENAVVRQWYTLTCGRAVTTNSEEDVVAEEFKFGKMRRPTVLLEIFFSTSTSTSTSKSAKSLNLNIEVDDFNNEQFSSPNNSPKLKPANSPLVQNINTEFPVRFSSPQKSGKRGLLTTAADDHDDDDDEVAPKRFLPTGLVSTFNQITLKNIDVHNIDENAKEVGMGDGWIEHSVNEAEIATYGGARVEGLQHFCFPDRLELWRGKRGPRSGDFTGGGEDEGEVEESEDYEDGDDGMDRYKSNVSSSSQNNSISNSSNNNKNNNAALVNLRDGTPAVFSWFVLSSCGESFDSEVTKTFGVVLKFFVRLGLELELARPIWTPVCLCLTSSIPIIGVMRAALIEMVDDLKDGDKSNLLVKRKIYRLMFVLPRPVLGVMTRVPWPCYSQASMASLNLMPHGESVRRAVDILGPKGLGILLSAMLCECKIVLVSEDHDDCGTPLITEFLESLLSPFTFPFPIIPVLPLKMIDFVEAPLPYVLG